MIRVLATVAVLSWPGERWFGADKVKHFLLSALVHSTTYSIARAAGVERPSSQAVAASTALGVGVLKEIRDRRVGKPLSLEDLLWDAAGAFAAGSLMNGTR